MCIFKVRCVCDCAPSSAACVECDLEQQNERRSADLRTVFRLLGVITLTSASDPGLAHHRTYCRASTWLFDQAGSNPSTTYTVSVAARHSVALLLARKALHLGHNCSNVTQQHIRAPALPCQEGKC